MTRVRRRKLSVESMKRTSSMKGFSLGEVLLSIAVLVVGILPIFASFSKGYETSSLGRRLVVASGLAQEGVELVQNVRSNAVLSLTSDFADWLPDDGATSWDDCRIDINDDVLNYPGNRMTCGGGPYDLEETDQGMVHTGAPGLFKRRIFMDYDSVGNSLKVVSVVYWGDTAPASFADVDSDCVSANRCVYAESELSPWR